MTWPPPVLDDFTGSDGSIDGRAVSAGGYTWESPLFVGNNIAQIASNAFAGDVGQDRDAGITTAIGPDCAVAVTITAGTFVHDGAGDITLRLFARVTDPLPATDTATTWYDLFPNFISGSNDEIRVRRMINASGTTILDANVGGELVAGVSFGASFIEETTGTRIRVYYKTAAGSWTEIGNVLDTDVSRPTGAGYVGLAAYAPSTGFTLDDFRFGDILGSTTGLLDDFNRANGAPGANWSTPSIPTFGAYTIVSNALDGATAFLNSYWNTIFGADQEVWADIATLPSAGNVARLLCRIQNPNTAGFQHYELLIDGAGTGLFIQKNVANVITTLQNCGTTVAAGDQVGLSVVGNTLRAYKNGVQVGTDQTDSTIAGPGYIGLVHYNTTAVVWDDFGGGELAVGTGPIGALGGIGW